MNLGYGIIVWTEQPIRHGGGHLLPQFYLGPNWWAAAEILGVTDCTMRRWREKLEKDGYAGLADRRKGKPSAQRIPLATIEKVLGLYKETNYDLNIRHFHEKVQDEHDTN